jgi:hypothetical protein
LKFANKEKALIASKTKESFKAEADRIKAEAYNVIYSFA